MADNYKIIGRSQTTDSPGGDVIRDVVRVTVQTKPSQVVFEFNQPLGSALNSSIAARAHTYSDEIESIVATPDVAAVSYVQDINPADNIVDYLRIWVVASTDEGEADGYFNQPFSNLDAADVAPKIVNLHKSLLATLSL